MAARIGYVLWGLFCLMLQDVKRALVEVMGGEPQIHQVMDALNRKQFQGRMLSAARQCSVASAVFALQHTIFANDSAVTTFYFIAPSPVHVVSLAQLHSA